VIVVVRQAPYLLRTDIDLEDVAKGLLQEKYPLAVMRPIRPLSKRREPVDVRRQAIGRSPLFTEWLPLGGCKNSDASEEDR
jgi:hypothetical protein